MFIGINPLGAVGCLRGWLVKKLYNKLNRICMDAIDLMYSSLN